MIPGLLPAVFLAVALPVQPPQASVERDCAPWDGPAFSLWIPAQPLGGPRQSWLHLRIWQSPDEAKGVLPFPQTGPRQKGVALFFLDLASPAAIRWSSQPRQELRGRVRFDRVNGRESVLGELDLTSSGNLRLRGRFEAGWLRRPGLVCG